MEEKNKMSRVLDITKLVMGAAAFSLVVSCGKDGEGEGKPGDSAPTAPTGSFGKEFKEAKTNEDKLKVVAKATGVTVDEIKGAIPAAPAANVGLPGALKDCFDEKTGKLLNNVKTSDILSALGITTDKQKLDFATVLGVSPVAAASEDLFDVLISELIVDKTDPKAHKAKAGYEKFYTHFSKFEKDLAAAKDDAAKKLAAKTFCDDVEKDTKAAAEWNNVSLLFTNLLDGGKLAKGAKYGLDLKLADGSVANPALFKDLTIANAADETLPLFKGLKAKDDKGADKDLKDLVGTDAKVKNETLMLAANDRYVKDKAKGDEYREAIINMLPAAVKAAIGGTDAAQAKNANTFVDTLISDLRKGARIVSVVSDDAISDAATGDALNLALIAALGKKTAKSKGGFAANDVAAGNLYIIHQHSDGSNDPVLYKVVANLRLNSGNFIIKSDDALKAFNAAQADGLSGTAVGIDVN